jgi:multiple sugar transport system substrate-binding protein
MWSNGPVIDEHFENRVAAFNEAHSGEIEVGLEFLPYDQYWQKLQLAYASGDLYDVYSGMSRPTVTTRRGSFSTSSR